MDHAGCGALNPGGRKAKERFRSRQHAETLGGEDKRRASYPSHHFHLGLTAHQFEASFQEEYFEAKLPLAKNLTQGYYFQLVDKAAAPGVPEGANTWRLAPETGTSSRQAARRSDRAPGKQALSKRAVC